MQVREHLFYRQKDARTVLAGHTVYISPYPQHDRCHVADGRPGPATVGGNHDDAAENPALLIIADQFRISMTMTMEVVRLSRTADMKKVIVAMTKQ